MKEWMPKNPCVGCLTVNSVTNCKDYCLSWERYNDKVAAQRKLLEYLEGYCKDHPMAKQTPLTEYKSFNIGGFYYNHRYLCPDCMADIKEELEQ